MAVIAVNFTGINDGWEINRTHGDFKFVVLLDELGSHAALDVRNAVAAWSGGPPAGYYISKLIAAPINRNPLAWEASMTWDIVQWAGTDPNPFMRPSSLTITWDEQTEAYFKDSNGDKVINSAGQRPEEFPVRVKGQMILQITKNLSIFAGAAIDALKFTTNSDVVTIEGSDYPVDSLLFKPATLQKTVEQVGGIKYVYYAATFRLATDHLYHKDKFEDRGYVDKNQIRKTNTDGTSLPAPWPLDGSGNFKANATDDPALITRVPYPSVSWGLSFD
jgi:hypothetical protein